YYAPGWVGATTINFNSIQSPSGAFNKLALGQTDASSIILQGGKSDGTIRSAIYGGGKSSYNSSTAGFWMGDDSGIWKFDIGNNTNYLRWDGSKLGIAGQITLEILEGEETGINISGSRIAGQSSTRTYYELGTARTSWVSSRGGVLRCSTYIDGDDTRDCYMDITHNTIMAYQKLFAVYGQNKILLTDATLSTGFLNWTLGSSVNIKGNCSIGSSYYTTSAPSDGCIIQGNVGIGTSSPSYKLHVEGQTKLNGNVGIGKNPTSYALDVQGNVLINGDLGVNGNVVLTGTLSGDISAINGVSGTFKSSDSPAKTITVTKGIITGIS
ncbi:MAG: hypothetical protein PHE29_13900, partial [Tissierellia bacterium]|nr:hypothetical protein [Tissierellia bacterium]